MVAVLAQEQTARPNQRWGRDRNDREFFQTALAQWDPAVDIGRFTSTNYWGGCSVGDFPGALIGATVARVVEWKSAPRSTAILFGFGFLCVAIGIATNQTYLCLTVMACRTG